MDNGFFTFPKLEDWNRLNNSELEKIYSLLDCFESNEQPTGNLEDFTRALQLDGWLYELRQRVEDTAISYFFTMFYYEKGIPDKRWFVSPGKDGSSVQYYPDFEDVHHFIKIWFDYFSDTLYYKLFSAWDILGHLLNVKYDLELRDENVYFSKALQKLESKDKNLYMCLDSIRMSPAYKKAHQIRRNITHNCLPRNADVNVIKRGKSVKIGLKQYIPSEEIVDNIHGTLGLFADTLKYILG